MARSFRASASAFLSTLSLRRATHHRPDIRLCRAISIHALLAESDSPKMRIHSEFRDFYPRSPCGERLMQGFFNFFRIKFLSTLSLRRATIWATILEALTLYFYPRSPCGERLKNTLSKVINRSISIHALLAESDPPRVIREPTAGQFLSTLSLRRATTWARGSRVTYVISIHALLAESDLFDTMQIVIVVVFLSTLSLRRATLIQNYDTRVWAHFYPRSPCGERLAIIIKYPQDTGYFYPRSPCGERL